MNWFRSAKQTISESDLIAYHLHELSPARERAVARAIAASALLAADSAAIEATLHAVQDKPAPIDPAAFSRTWEAIRPALVPFAALPLAAPRWRTPALAAAGLAGIALVFLFTRQHAAVSPMPAPSASTAETDPESKGPTRAGADGPESQPLTRLPSTAGQRPSLHSGVYYRPTQPQGRPPVHLLANAISPQPVAIPGPSTERAAIPLTTQPAFAPPVASVAGLTPQPVPGSQASGGGGSQASNKGSGKVRARGGNNNPSREQDIMLGAGGTFTRPSTLSVANQSVANQSGTQTGLQTATKAILAVGAYHRQFRSAVGYRVTLSYTRPDFTYTYPVSGGVNSRIYEAVGTYVVNGPHHGRLSTAVDAGLGLSLFLPVSPMPLPGKVISLSGVAGASADLALSKHWGLRVGYRAQLSKGPNFKTDNGVVATSSSLVVTHQPFAGIVYRFGQKDTPRP